MPKEKVIYQTNIPVEVQLAYTDGKKVAGQYPDTFMYTLRDDKVMFVPQSVRDRIQELQPGVGGLLSICKREVRSEDGTPQIEWQVTAKLDGNGEDGRHQNGDGANSPIAKLNEGNKPNQPATPIDPPAPNQSVQSQPAVTKPPTNGGSPTRSSSALDLVADRLEGKAPSSVNSAKASADAKPNSNGYDHITLSMKKALQGALEATKAVEQYAEEISFQDPNGDPFRFSHVDIRAIGLSMFIEARRRNW